MDYFGHTVLEYVLERLLHLSRKQSKQYACRCIEHIHLEYYITWWHIHEHSE
jgi:hypothetical protein